MRYALLLCAVLPVLFFASCSKDAPNATANLGPTSGVIVADINGLAWAAPDGYVSRSANSVQLFGQRDQTNYIRITVSPYTGVRNYPLDGLSNIVYYESGVEYTSISGQITITAEDDYHMEGSFSAEVVGTGARSLQFTNGQFNIAKQ